MLVTDKAASGVAPITVDKNGTTNSSPYNLYMCPSCSTIAGENAIIVVPGANNHLTVEDVRNVESLIKSASVLMCQLEVPVATTLEALKLGKKHGGVFIMHIIKAHMSMLCTYYSEDHVECSPSKLS